MKLIEFLEKVSTDQEVKILAGCDTAYNKAIEGPVGDLTFKQLRPYICREVDFIYSSGSKMLIETVGKDT